MDPNRKLWNERHQKLTLALAKGNRDKAIELFLTQHAMVHTARVTATGLWSFEDELLEAMTDQEIRQIPARGEHSIAWILFHLSRIEDMTMNMLVAGTSQLFTSDDWAKRMNVNVMHSANSMSASSVVDLSTNIDIKCLRAYRMTLARRTRQIVRNLEAKEFKQKVDPARIENIMKEGAVASEAMDILYYWSKKTIAGLLLMPPTRHCILHLNEGMKIKEKIRQGI